MCKPLPPITINHNINVRIVNPQKIPKPPTPPRVSFKTVGAAAISCALIASEALPFFDDVKANGILHGLIMYLEQK